MRTLSNRKREILETKVKKKFENELKKQDN